MGMCRQNSHPLIYGTRMFTSSTRMRSRPASATAGGADRLGHFDLGAVDRRVCAVDPDVLGGIGYRLLATPTADRLWPGFRRATAVSPGRAPGGPPASALA